MSTPIADQAEREAALDPQHSYIVQAPAGSGKTELLTQRALGLLARVDAPEEVVAITFTRKAAAEMRHRLLDALTAAEGPAPQATHARHSHALAAEVLRRDQALGWDLRQNPGRLRVMTYDALAGHLTRQSPVLSGLSPGHRVTTQAGQLYQEAARACLAHVDQETEYGAAVRDTLAHFDGRSQQVQDQLVRMLARRDQWLPLVADATARPPRARMEHCLQQIRAQALQAARSALGSAALEQLLELARYAHDQRLRLTPDKPPPTLLATSSDELDQQDSNWLCLLELLLTQKDEWRSPKGLNRGVGFPTAKEGPADAAQRKQQMVELLNELSAREELLAPLVAIRGLPAARFNDAQWQSLESLLNCLRLAAAELKLVCARRGELDFIEIAARAREALGPVDAPSELALKLDYQIRHLLLDEFQDTSLPQFQLVSRLLNGWEAGDGRTVFAVGDPMQSIYRFRQADVRLFLQAWEQGFANVPLQRLRLSCNFRSVPGVIEWVNRAFDGDQGGAFPKQDDPLAGASRYAPSVAVRAAIDEQPAVQLHAVADDGGAAEAEQLLQLIRIEQNQNPDASIAVLVRARGHLRAIIPALQQAGIAFQAVELDRLADWPAVRDIHALCRALAHPLDRLAWLSVLRAPWAGLRLADLLALTEAAGPNGSLLTALQTGGGALSAEGQQIIQRLLPPLQASLDSRGQQPFAQCVESAWLALGGAALTASARETVRDYLSLLNEHCPTGDLADFAAFEQAIQEQKISTTAAPGCRLQLLTMHKSKGLQFDAVLLPGLARGAARSDQPAVVWTEVLGRPGGEVEPLIAPIHPTGAEKDPIYDFALRTEAQRESLERARLLYVAATRARNRLHLLASLKTDDQGAPRPPPSGSLLSLISASLALPDQLSPTAQHDETSDEPVYPDPPALQRIVPDTRLPAWPVSPLRGQSYVESVPVEAAEPELEPSADEPADSDGSARIIGTVFHLCAQALADEQAASGASLPELDAMIQRLPSILRQHGLPESRQAEALTRLGDGLKDLLHSERGRWLLAAHPEAGNEIEFSTQMAGGVAQRIVDRSFVDEAGTRWIIDYKTSWREGAEPGQVLAAEIRRYQPQLEAYARLFRALEDRPTRCALYFPMMGHWHEWAPAPAAAAATDENWEPSHN